MAKELETVSSIRLGDRLCLGVDFGTLRNQNGSDYANHLSHVQDKNLEVLRRIREIDLASKRGYTSEKLLTITVYGSASLASYQRIPCFYDPKIIEIQGWIDLITSTLLPLSINENDTFRKHVKYRGID